MTTQIDLNTGGGLFELAVEKVAGVPISGIKVYAFTPAGSYLGLSATTDSSGKVSFSLSNGSYMFRADYLGYQFWTQVYGIPETSSAALTLPHQDVTVSVNQIYDTGATGLPNLKIYLFTASGAYMGKSAVTDSAGQAVLSLPEKDYKFRADYLGSQFWSDAISWQDTDIDIGHGKINIHVTNNGSAVINAPVYLFTDSGAYLGKNQKTDAAGTTSFILPEKPFKFRIDYNGTQYWSDTTSPLPHSDLVIQMQLEVFSSKLTNDPNPTRFDGIPPERPTIMYASLGSITTLLTQSIIAQTPQKKLYFYLNDHLGTPIKIIDDQNTIVWAADYKPFGEVDITTEAMENNFRFPGQYYDVESGLHYNYHRYYQPEAGRYLRADPIGIMRGKNHLFTYSLNNSLSFLDPAGLSVFAECTYYSGGYYIGIGILECDLAGSLCINGIRERAKYFAILGGINIGSPVGMTSFTLEFKKSDDVRSLAGPTTMVQSSSAIGVGASFGQICLGYDCSSGWTGQKGIDLSVDICGGYGRVTDIVDESCCEN